MCPKIVKDTIKSSNYLIFSLYKDSRRVEGLIKKVNGVISLIEMEESEVIRKIDDLKSSIISLNNSMNVYKKRNNDPLFIGIDNLNRIGRYSFHDNRFYYSRKTLQTYEILNLIDYREKFEGRKDRWTSTYFNRNIKSTVYRFMREEIILNVIVEDNGEISLHFMYNKKQYHLPIGKFYYFYINGTRVKIINPSLSISHVNIDINRIDGKEYLVFELTQYTRNERRIFHESITRTAPYIKFFDKNIKKLLSHSVNDNKCNHFLPMFENTDLLPLLDNQDLFKNTYTSYIEFDLQNFLYLLPIKFCPFVENFSDISFFFPIYQIEYVDNLDLLDCDAFDDRHIINQSYYQLQDIVNQL